MTPTHNRDAMLAQLIEFLGDEHSIEKLSSTLDETWSQLSAIALPQDVIQSVIERLLSPDSFTPETNSIASPNHKRRKTSETVQTQTEPKKPENAFERLFKASASAAPASGITHTLLTAENVSAHLPCELFPGWLSPTDSDSLLRFLMQSAKENDLWAVTKYYINEREVLTSHKSAIFVDLAERDFRHTFQGSDSKGIPYSSSKVLLETSRRVNAFVTQRIRDLRVRLETSVSKSPVEKNGTWTGNFCVANEYLHGKQTTGFHADSLAYIGPRCVIASLSVGATRTFRIRRVKGAAEGYVWDFLEDDKVVEDTVGVAEADNHCLKNLPSASSDTVFSIKLPHGSLLIMYPPMQELYKHEIGPEKHFQGHPISGLARYNLTFRMYRREFENPPFCKCGVRTDLKPVFKGSNGLKRDEKYYYSCVLGRGEQLGCGFFEWLK
ncbi:hypothetical protein HDU79_001641 [Rhizoclosmatium sp. JEL0117]|nr:hypothetical protein HDU79_001641 [Rhizoclosmatium sp. JEL0117]